MQLDRVEASYFAKPTNYGFHSTGFFGWRSTEWTLIITEPLTTGIFMEAKVIGVLNLLTIMKLTTRLLLYQPTTEKHWQRNQFTRRPTSTIVETELRHHFNHYRIWKKPGSTVVKGFGDVERAKQIIHRSITRWMKNKSHVWLLIKTEETGERYLCRKNETPPVNECRLSGIIVA